MCSYNKLLTFKLTPSNTREHVLIQQLFEPGVVVYAYNPTLRRLRQRD